MYSILIPVKFEVFVKKKKKCTEITFYGGLEINIRSKTLIISVFVGRHTSVKT
jgi:hypothetical protein